MLSSSDRHGRLRRPRPVMSPYAGVPLLLVTLLYPKREQIKKILTDIEEQDLKTHTVTTVKEIVASKRRQRASIVELSESIRWLVPKFEKFQPACWWFGAFALVLRLCQSSMMVMFENQSIQAGCASIIAQVAICAQRNLAPYRRASDNEIALYAQWLIFTWCSMLLLRVIGAVAFLPTFVVGLFCVIPTVAVVARALQSARIDIVNEFQLLKQTAVNDSVVTRKRKYQKGDFVLMDVKVRKRRPSELLRLDDDDALTAVAEDTQERGNGDDAVEAGAAQIQGWQISLCMIDDGTPTASSGGGSWGGGVLFCGEMQPDLPTERPPGA